MPFEYTRRDLRTAAELRALAHPLRAALLEFLITDGPLTATECAERTGESPANCSWHLRQLAKYGFAEEAGGGVGRQRPWRALTIGLRYDTDDAEPEVAAAGEALSQVWLEHEVRRYRAYLQRRLAEPGEPADWVAAASSTQSLAWLTVEELQELSATIEAAFLAHVDRLDAANRPPNTRLVRLVALLFPDRAAGAPEDTEDPEGGAYEPSQPRPEDD